MTRDSFMQSNLALQATAYVGRTVLVRQNRAFLAGCSGMQVFIDVPEHGIDMLLSVFSLEKTLQKQWLVTQVNPGLLPVYWDGLNQRNLPVPPGYYFLLAQSKSGLDIPVLMTANVDSVSIGDHGEGLLLNVSGRGDLTLDQVRLID